MIRQLLMQQKNWEKTAVFEDEEKISYRTLLERALGISARLPSASRSTVAILLPDGYRYIAALWATLLAGHIAFPLNARLTEHELLPILRFASVDILITNKELSAAFTAESFPFEIVYLEECPLFGNQNHIVWDMKQDEIMLLLNTSGSTGTPKIVALCERNVEASLFGYLEKFQFEQTLPVRFLLAAPFSSVYGIMVLSACLFCSFSLVVPPKSFTLTSFYQTVERYQVTHYEGGTAPLLLMEQTAGRAVLFDVSSLTGVGFGGSTVSGQTLENILKIHPHFRFQQGYGMTEAAPLIAKHPHGKLKKPDSVGTAIVGVELAIATENGITRLPRQTGEVVAKGSNVMIGYYKNSEETYRTVKDHYLYTGDIGYLDEEGYLFLCGRKKNMVIVRGFNVYPEEVENCIQNSLLAIDCCVYGEEDEKGNETLCALVVPTHPEVDENQIKAHCQTQLADYKIPQKIILCDAVPRTAAGKIARGNFADAAPADT